MSAPTTRAPGRAASGVDPFTAGILVAGLVVGMPMAVAWGLVAGHVVRAVLVPAAAVAITAWLWRRCRGSAGMRADLHAPLVRRGDLPRFLAGALVAGAGLVWLLVGGVR